MLAATIFAGSCASDAPPLGSATVAESATAPTPAPTPGSIESSAEDKSAEYKSATARTAAVVADLADTPSSSVAAQFLDAVQNECALGDCEQRVPWLIDLLRLQVSTGVSRDISALLQEITGIEATERIPDLIAYGSWAWSNRLDGGDGYQEYKTALYERIDPAFGPLLASVEDPVELAAIQWGGVPVGGIPELNDPERVPAADADWMVDDEVVIGVSNNDEAVAYPLRVLARHELANDTVGGEELAIVYCTLCRSALVFNSVVQGQTLDFLTSGVLLNSNKIMVDTQTNTLWHHLRGIGIGGELAGVELEQRPVSISRWSDWVTDHPNTQVITLPRPIFFDDPERPPIAYDYTPGEAYRSYYENPDVWFPVLDTPDTFPLKSEVIGIEHGGDSLALRVADIAGTEAFDVEVGGQTFTVEPTAVSARVVDSSGERQIVEQSFWFAWYANHPDTRTR